MELKGSVFKKFERNNLFQMSCSGMYRTLINFYVLCVTSRRSFDPNLISFFLVVDIRERFHYIILISIVALRNLTEFNWNLGK